MHRPPRHGAPRARQDSPARAGAGEVTTAPRAARHAAERRTRAQRAAAALAVVSRARAGRVAVAGVLGLGVVAAATGAVTAGAPTTAAGGSAPALVDRAPVALPADVVDALRAERATAADHRQEVAAEQAAEAAARAAAEREAAERAAAEQAAAEEAAAERAAAAEAEAAREQEAASRSAQRDPRAVAASMVGDHGWGSEQMSCLDQLWTKESSWQWDADNPTSSAYGIPQALPGEKMAEAGADWETNPVTQIRWGLDYIDASYGTPCSAWSHSQATDWY
ncbi:hypothetical protein WDZ17_13245 [Pseudokineococcus basanitobsidens]|uniref:Transglycosylase-like protein with SLT domain n=1 Tax=Pseudokineococcus basanitobsidens TaxID=1926649 RepID=A0ABU8RMK3_9ACTN